MSYQADETLACWRQRCGDAVVWQQWQQLIQALPVPVLLACADWAMARQALDVLRAALLRLDVLDEGVQPQQHNHRGRLWGALADFARAGHAFQQALKQQPDYWPAHLNLALLARQNKDWRGCYAHSTQVLLQQPDNQQACLLAGLACMQIHRQEEGRVQLARLARMTDAEVALRQQALYALLEDGQMWGDVAAVRRWQQLLAEVVPDDPFIALIAAELAMLQGQDAAALQALQDLDPLLPSKDTRALQIYARLARRDASIRGAAITALQTRLQQADADDGMTQYRLHNALGRLLEQEQSYDAAMPHFIQGNALRPPGNFDLAQHDAAMEDLKQLFDADFFRQHDDAATAKRAPWIFIVGMIRSGSSLTEQILACHPQVCALGERTALGPTMNLASRLTGHRLPSPFCLRYLKASDRQALVHRFQEDVPAQAFQPGHRVTDKTLISYMYLGALQVLFPDARVIHCVRQPLDNCLSAFTTDLHEPHPYTRDLYELGRYYRAYRDLMQHYEQVLSLPVFTLSYEALTADPRSTVASLLAFCGLPWHEGCLHFHQHERHVATASREQVRRSMYRDSVARWRHYEAWLQPLQRGLGAQWSQV